MAAVFVQERNATSILVMSVSSWCEGHRRRQELNETSFCKFKCKKFRKFSRKSLLSSRSTGVYSHQETPKSMFSWRAETEERCHWKGLEYWKVICYSLKCELRVVILLLKRLYTSKSQDGQALQVHILTSFGLKFGQDFRSIPYINLTIMYTLTVERRQNLEQQKAFGTS